MAVTPAQGPTAGGTSVLIDSQAFRFVEVSAGEGHTVGLTADGAVYAWGDNSFGQLGNGTSTSSTVPVPVDTSGVLDGVTIVQVSAGYSHSVALADDGNIYTWGFGFYGQLGNGTAGGGSDSLVPVVVDATGALAGRTITSIEAGYYSTTAIDSMGATYAWGHGGYGQLGNGTTAHASVPVAVDAHGVLSGVRVVQVAAGWDHMIAVSDDGKAFAWGSNGSGQLGTGTTASSLVPVAVDATGVLSGITVTQLAVGSTHSLALSADGRVFTWGGNDRGQLGTGSSPGSLVPIEVSSMGALAGKTISQVAGGWEHSVALANDGTVVTWGGNGFGQLGDSSSADSYLPVVAAGTGATVTGVDAGWEHTVAWAADGSAYAWGNNGNGQAGNGSTDDTSRPVPTLMPELQVLFGGIPSTSVVRVDQSTVRAMTPPHPSGLVDIEVRQGGNAKYALVTDLAEDAFAYGAAPKIVEHPASAQVEPNSMVRLTASADADEASSAQWQVRDPESGAWTNLTGGSSIVTGLRTVAEISVTAPVTGQAEYRVVFTNPLGMVVTETAALAIPTLLGAGLDPSIEDPSMARPGPVSSPTGADVAEVVAHDDASPDSELAATGFGVVGTAIVAAMLIGVGVVTRRVRATTHR